MGRDKKLACHICGNNGLAIFLSLGPTPLANAFLREEELSLPEPQYPLDVCYCERCGLVQLTEIVPAEILFKDYLYQTGVSQTMVAHMAELATEVMARQKPKPGVLVVDIGSNDGTLLCNFKPFKVKVLGIEPASHIAALAEKRDVETLKVFFDEELGLWLRSERGFADIILATNVLAHVGHLDSFLRGINHLLSNDGVLVIEVPYVIDMLERVEFDTIYHEHLRYFGVRPLVELFTRFSMVVVGVNRIEVHGGSLRIWVKKNPATQSLAVGELLRLERDKGFDTLKPYLEFSQKVKQLREELPQLLRGLRGRGMRIIGYGAPAKGNTLLNYCQIGPDLLDYIVDTTPSKQGRYSPGMHIPVVPVARFHQDRPEYALMLAWNYEVEILKKEQAYLNFGGKFIVPVPMPRVIP